MNDWSEIAKQSKDPCFVALHKDDAESLRKCLSEGRQVTERFHAGRTFLHLAAELGASKCAGLLLENGADLEARMEFVGYSPLILAVGFCHLDLVRMFLRNGAQLRYEVTPEHSAETQLKMRAQFERLTSEADKKIAALIPFPLEPQSDDIVKMMMEASLRMREVNALEQCHDYAMLRFLVDDCGMDVNQDFHGGDWPLKTFAEAGDANSVSFLLKRGAKPDLTSTGDTALHAAVSANSPECVRLLLEAGANPNQEDVDLFVPTSRVSSHQVLDILLEYGADVNIPDQCGFKPSHWVKQPDLKKRLLKLEREMSAISATDTTLPTRNRKRRPSS